MVVMSANHYAMYAMPDSVHAGVSRARWSYVPVQCAPADGIKSHSLCTLCLRPTAESTSATLMLVQHSCQWGKEGLCSASWSSHKLQTGQLVIVVSGSGALLNLLLGLDVSNDLP